MHSTPHAFLTLKQEPNWCHIWSSARIFVPQPDSTPCSASTFPLQLLLWGETAISDPQRPFQKFWTLSEFKALRSRRNLPRCNSSRGAMVVIVAANFSCIAKPVFSQRTVHRERHSSGEISRVFYCKSPRTPATVSFAAACSVKIENIFIPRKRTADVKSVILHICLPK